MTAAIARSITTLGMAAGLGAAVALGQPTSGRAAAHIEAARRAAGQEFKPVFDRTCGELTPPSAPAVPRRPGPPARDSWYAEPAKVFDNLYFLGQTEYSVWAVTTSEGIILVDAIFDYSVEEEVVGGMKKLGLDPTQIKYVVVSHGHADHSGGAKFLQETFGARVVMSEADWELLDRGPEPKPRRDMVATDGMKLTLGDTTLTFYVTPGHTLGTLSTLIPVKENGRTYVAAEWGGTAFNWVANPKAYVTADRPARFWFDTYHRSAQRFRDIVAREGAAVILANHTAFDGTKRHLPALAGRKPGDPNPYVVGKEDVLRYMTVVDECAQAGLAGLEP